MKKVVIVAMMLISTMLLAQNWYSSKEKIENLRPKINSKDTLWYGYGETAAWVFQIKSERATYINVNDFGLEYPINLDALSSYLYDTGATFTYKIYDKDGITPLFQSDPGVSFKGYNDLFLDTPVIMKDDFWFSIVPQADGLPRIVSTDVIDSEHSFYGQPGEWNPLPDADERYEWMNYVSLSPYTGADTFPPGIRGITGVENFFFINADISVMIQDQSALAEVYGEYDLGAGWVQFPMTASKTTYVYNGIIPGQDHGVTAKVRFYAEDVLGYNTTSDEYTVTWSKELPLIEEGFENETFPPVGWTLQTTAGNGFIKTPNVTQGAAHEGIYTAAHMDEMEDCNSWLITPKVSIPNTGFCTLFLWQYGYYLQYVTSGIHEICVSTDMITWDVIYSGYPPVGDTGSGGVWEKLIFTLKEYAGTEIYIGFHFAANYEDQWYIDDISLIYDDQGPVITEIKGNEALLPVIGAYLNNPIILNLKTSDKSGTKSVTANYDIGGQTGNIILSESKEEEGYWTGSIPAQSSEADGTINFTLTDIGDLQTITGNYDISFVADDGVPVIKNFSFGAPVLVTQDMTISITLEDESEISSAICYYSKDNWLTETQFDMTLSKIHEYTYQCVIPAEPEETFAEVRFELSDAPGNHLNSGTYSVKWLEGKVVIFDDFDANHHPEFWDWTTTGTTWAIVDNQSVSPTHSLTDSPYGNYPNAKKNPLRTNFMDFSDYLAATAFFWAKIDIEAEWDFCYLQGTTNTDSEPANEFWTELAAFDGDKLPWEYFEVNLGAFAKQDSVRFRFYLVSDAYVNPDGIYIDDFMIIGYSKDYAPPLIIYSGPTVIEAGEYTIPREFTIPVGMGDYKFELDLIDISDISEVKVVYSVDSGPEQEALPPIFSGPTGTYEMVIPEQPAGTKVSYKVVATDNSEYLNSGETKYYNIHFGNYLYYQNGDDFVDYLDIIGTDPGASAQAVATRCTMGPMDDVKGHYRSNLVAITIENYIDENYPSDPMYVHVWEDAYGVPGKDIIEPILTQQASTILWSYEITWVDLRPYADKLSAIEGDFFVGFTSAGAATNVLYEVVAIHIANPDYINFQRSWLGTGDADDLTWAHDPLDIYHISAVIGDYEYVDAPLPPRGFTVKNVSGSNELNWLSDPDPSIDHYNVYRGDTASFEIVTPIGSVLAANPSTYTDIAPPAGSLYYKITAVDAGGVESSPTLGVEPTGIEDENIPLITKLYQNYPNPFNPETTINFSIAENAKVSLSVYNSNGQTVANLVNDNLRIGYHSVKFDGAKLTSGVYYTVLKVNNKVMTNKMMILK